MLLKAFCCFLFGDTVTHHVFLKFPTPSGSQQNLEKSYTLSKGSLVYDLAKKVYEDFGSKC